MTRVYLPANRSGVVGSYGGDAMPSTFVIDPEGIIRYVHHGYNDGDEQVLRHELDQLQKP